MEFSETESRRFKRIVFRENVDSIDPDTLISQLYSNDIDLLILRIPVENLREIVKIADLKIPYLVADTLVYYYTDLEAYTPNELKNSLTFEVCTEEKIPILTNLVSEIFVDYKNHYFTNPFIDISAIKEGYIEWATNFVGKTESGKIVFLIKEDTIYAGFATCSYDADSHEAEGVLYGVLSQFSGKGIYGDIIRFTQSYFKEKKFLTMKVSTQVQNYAVQKVWAREGFYLKKALLTIHINSLMQVSEENPKNIKISTGKEIDNQNLLQIIKEILTVNYPDYQIQDFQFRVIKSIQANTSYNIQITCPKIDSILKQKLLLAKVLDKEGNLFQYYYITLVC